MMNRGGQVNKVFVFVFSTIVVLFGAFLVVKFIMAFTSDTEQIYEQKFFEQLEQNYDTVFKTYGSEKSYRYKVSSKVKQVCFVANYGCIDSLSEIDDAYDTGLDNMRLLFEAGDNVIVFDNDDVLVSKNIGTFLVDAPGCFCVDVRSGSSFGLLMQNEKSKVVFAPIE